MGPFRIKSRLVCTVFLVAFVLSSQVSANSRCEALAKASLSDTVILSAHGIPAGTANVTGVPAAQAPEMAETVPGGRPFFGSGLSGELPAFCRIKLLVNPQIYIEVWLPEHKWNKRFRGEGGSGFGGMINYAGMADAVRAGYATASTNAGHPDYMGATFTLKRDSSLNRELVDDFAFRSVHELVVKTKQLIKLYYKIAPEYSYWRGCSTGGREGLIAVQRFPEEYDGVLAGSPAINWDRYIPSMLWAQVVIQQEVGHVIDMEKLDHVTTAAVAACDADDGVIDEIIGNPRNCRFDPASLVCSGEGVQRTCLTVAEARAIRKLWDGPASSRTGERLWFGYERGPHVATLLSRPSAVMDALGDYIKYWVRQDRNFDWRRITPDEFERDLRLSSKKFHEVLGADQADLQAWKRHGGKLLIWHDENDIAVPPRGTVRYFKQVLEANGGNTEVDKFARLYLVPGSNHCGVGTAAPFPDHLFNVLVKWVEGGIVPDSVTATQNLPGGASRTRPICPYPLMAKWSGHGSSDRAENFSCVRGEAEADTLQIATIKH